MDTKLKWIITLMGFCVIIISNSCGKLCLEGPSAAFNFQIGVRAYPDKDSIRVGDTVWLEVNAPTHLIDRNTNKVIDYSGAENLGSAIGFIKLLGKNNAKDAANNFNYYLIKGLSLNNPSTEKIREYRFSESNNNYTFKLGIIPKEKGIFKIFVSNAANVYRKGDKCTKANFEINFGNTNQHLYFNNILAPDVDLQPGAGVYLFRVY